MAKQSQRLPSNSDCKFTSQLFHVGFMVDKSETGQIFIRNSPIIFPNTNFLHSHLFHLVHFTSVTDLVNWPLSLALSYSEGVSSNLIPSIGLVTI